MLVYQDVISGDELFSDSYPIQLIDDLYYEVEGKNITISNDIDPSLIGGNAAAEAAEEDEGVDSSCVTGINVVLSHKLQETGFNKDSFKDWLKTYMKEIKKRVEEKSPDRVDKFTKGMQGFAKEILGKFNDFRFYTGESMNPEGMIVLQKYKSDEITPVFIFFKDGLKEAKYVRNIKKLIMLTFCFMLLFIIIQVKIQSNGSNSSNEELTSFKRVMQLVKLKK